jgi:hypothetical protein
MLSVTWYFQLVGAEIQVIDCDSDLDLTPLQRMARMLAKGYLSAAATFCLTMRWRKTFLTELNEAGLRNCKAVPQTHDISVASIGFARSYRGSPSASRRASTA